MRHLTDSELIDHVLKYDTDPIRLRLAKIMDNTKGNLLDGLEYAGMDRETWLFENTWDAGQYIRHLEEEINILNDDLHRVREKIAEMEAMTVIELISNLKDTIYREQARAALAVKYQREAEDREKETKKKLDMWAILNR